MTVVHRRKGFSACQTTPQNLLLRATDEIETVSTARLERSKVTHVYDMAMINKVLVVPSVRGDVL